MVEVYFGDFLSAFSSRDRVLSSVSVVRCPRRKAGRAPRLVRQMCYFMLSDFSSGRSAGCGLPVELRRVVGFVHVVRFLGKLLRYVYSGEVVVSFIWLSEVFVCERMNLLVLLSWELPEF